ncbi:MAG TPA: hypothetical protein VLG09_01620 [Candidatus Saccharimonadales bacterium]|nr:hypothetical protein [Candidatus Saccharimonadales bacterium]
MKYILAVDPGKRNGVAIFEDVKDGKLHYNAIHTVDELIDLTNQISSDFLSAIVVEDYIINGSRNNGSRGEAIQVIGILRALAARLGIPFVKQPPEKRLIAAKWAGESVRKSHMPDDQSARLHGIFYLRGQGKYTTILERQYKSD